MKEEFNEQRELDKERLRILIFSFIIFAITLTGLLIFYPDVLKITGNVIIDSAFVVIAFIIGFFFINTPKKRLEYFKWEEKWRKRGLKIRWLTLLGLFFLGLCFLSYKIYPEKEWWVILLIPTILILATDYYRSSFLFKK